LNSVLLSRFDLDPRTQRFLLSQLQTLKHPDYGRPYVMERLEKLILGREAEGEQMLLQAVGDSSTEFNTQQILSALLDATQRNVTMGGRTRHDIVRRLLQKRQRATEQHQITGALDFLEQWAQISAAPSAAFSTIRSLIAPDDAEAQAMLADWEQVIDLLSAYDIPTARIHIQPDLARSWDYYTGIVFELYSENGLHLAGGGRYDELIRLVGGQHDVPAVGFVYYPDQILAALPSPEHTANAAITVTVSRETQAAGIRWAQALRSRNVAVVLMPTDRPAEASGEVLTAAADGSIRYDGKTYAESDLDLLMNDLKRA
jgi:histidyl-tRNA synthetase